MFDSSVRRKAGAGIFVLSFVLASVPRASEASTVSCKIPQPCALYTNTSGPGLEGVTTYAATSSSNGTYGLEGLDSSTNKNHYNVGVYGYSPHGSGLRGEGLYGIGVTAVSNSGTGLNATSSSGTAIAASSSSGNGIVAKTAATNTSTSHYGVTGNDTSTNVGNNAGVLGTTINGGYGVEGTSGNNALGGVFGSATTAPGVIGSSASNVGVYGESSSNYGLYGSGTYGVYGTGPTGGAEGISSSGFGVYGLSTSGAGVSARSSSGPALSANSSSGDGIDAATSGGIGAFIINTNGNGVDARGSYIALLGRSDSYPMLLTTASGSNLFYVDGSGNVYSHGTYSTFAATRSGALSTAFTTRSTTPNVEDVGDARLVNGTATVAFDPAFSASIDARATYHVFLTPNGDTRGLYVAMKTAAGFVVRETQGGRGTLSFDYRVVASTPGHASERMALVGSSFDGSPKAAPVPHRAFPTPRLAAPPTARGRAIR